MKKQMAAKKSIPLTTYKIKKLADRPLLLN
jgi:hypothetical protein